MRQTDLQGRLARARARAAWPVRRTTLNAPQLPLVDAPPGERIGMVYDLTLAAWAMARRAIPSYDRASTPGRVIRAD